MQKNKSRNIPFPPALKLFLRGYIIIAFILIMAHYGIVSHVPFLIFLVTVVSISMVFGVGYMLVVTGRPVRASKFGVPGTALFFVKGIMVLYFVSLLAEHGILPERITSLLMLGIAGILILAGVASYLYEILDRTRPIPSRKPGAKTRTR